MNEETIKEADNREVIQSPLNKTFADKYYFIMNLPEALKNLKSKYNVDNKGVGIQKESIKWALISAAVPAINIKAESVQYQGGNVYISSHTKTPYDPLTIKFKVDNKYANYFTMYEWINFIYNESGGHYDAEKLANGNSGLGEYATNISIVGLDEYNNPVIQWIFTHAFPTQLTNFDLNYQNTEELECTATFVFSQLKIRNILLGNLNAKVS